MQDRPLDIESGMTGIVALAIARFNPTASRSFCLVSMVSLFCLFPSHLLLAQRDFNKCVYCGGELSAIGTGKAACTCSTACREAREFLQAKGRSGYGSCGE